MVRLLLLGIGLVLSATLLLSVPSGAQELASEQRTTMLDTPTPTPTCDPTWSFSYGPSLGGWTNYLFGVSALSSDDIWAVGEYATAYGVPAQTLTLHWNGTSWNIVPGANTPDPNHLAGVAGVSTNDVWAVGYHDITTYTPQSFIEHWDGTQWSIVPSPTV